MLDHQPVRLPPAMQLAGKHWLTLASVSRALGKGGGYLYSRLRSSGWRAALESSGDLAKRKGTLWISAGGLSDYAERGVGRTWWRDDLIAQLAPLLSDAPPVMGPASGARGLQERVEQLEEQVAQLRSLLRPLGKI